MSIASEIQRITGNVADAYTAANAKGATMPVSQNSDNLATTISTIPSGITPTGTKNITANGVYDVTNYASADVQVPTTAPASYRAFEVNGSGRLVSSTTTNWVSLPSNAPNIDEYLFYGAYKNSTAVTGALDLSSVKFVGSRAFCYCFYNCTGLTSVDLSSLKTVSGGAFAYCFNGCTSLQTVDLSSLSRIASGEAFNYAFKNCTALTSVDLSSVRSIGEDYGTSCCYYMFDGCTNLITVDLRNLENIDSTGGNCCSWMFSGCSSLSSINLSKLMAWRNNSNTQIFSRCSALTSLTFSNLVTLAGTSLQNAFEYTGLQTLSFPKLVYFNNMNYNSVFSNTLKGVIGCTVHFPSNLQSVMSSWSNITNGMNGTNTNILWDLPSTDNLDLSDITSYDSNALDGLGYNYPMTTITSVNLGNLETIGSKGSFVNTFTGSTALTTFNMGKLKLAAGNIQQILRNCTSLTSVDMSKLEVSSYSNGMNNMFAGCTSLTSVDFGHLTTLASTSKMGSCFYGCTNLASVDLSSLKTLSSSSSVFDSMFANTAITSVSLPALDKATNNNRLKNILKNTTGVTLHLPSNMTYKSQITPSVVSGTNSIVLFDLPATVTLTGADTIEYERNPIDDTATALAWRKVGYDTDGLVLDWTPYYTSGTTDPAVGDTICSDSACTTTVTTISAVA